MTLNFEKPINRLGFVIFCVSVACCLLAFFVTYRTYFSISWAWVAHLVLDESREWQQSLFKLGLAGAAVGAALAWNFLEQVKRVYRWVAKA